VQPLTGMGIQRGWEPEHVEEAPELENPHRPGRSVTCLTLAPRLREGFGLAAGWLPRGRLAEEEAAAAAHSLHQPTAAGIGGNLPEEPLP
jgi:hypothetical protein